MEYFIENKKVYGRKVANNAAQSLSLWIKMYTYDIGVEASTTADWITVGTITHKTSPEPTHPEATLFRIPLVLKNNGSASSVRRTATVTLTIEDQEFYVDIIQSNKKDFVACNIGEDMVFSGEGERTVEIWNTDARTVEPYFEGEAYGDIRLNDIMAQYLDSNITWKDGGYGDYDNNGKLFYACDNQGNIMQYSVWNSYEKGDGGARNIPFYHDVYSNTTILFNIIRSDYLYLDVDGERADEFDMTDSHIKKIELSGLMIRDGAKIHIYGDSEDHTDEELEATYHCEERPFLLYENITGAWETFPINGNMVKRDENGFSGLTTQKRGKTNFKNVITESYTCHIRINKEDRDKMYNLLSSNRIYLNGFEDEVTITDKTFEYSPSLNGKTAALDFNIEVSKRKERRL